MSDSILVSVYGSGQTHARHNFKERIKPKRVYAIETYQHTGDNPSCK